MYLRSCCIVRPILVPFIALTVFAVAVTVLYPAPTGAATEMKLHVISTVSCAIPGSKTGICPPPPNHS
jgi:hypothetical protein